VKENTKISIKDRFYQHSNW